MLRVPDPPAVVPTVSVAVRSLSILRLPEVKAKTRLCRSTIYAQVADGLFPPGFSLGARAVGWIESEVDAVLAARMAGADEREIKKLILELVAARCGGGVSSRRVGP
ncbi:MAG: AlpA family phage regulatory protein [Proteobacteria bacterium]|nr:AlpA family phage regulatory protein [Pseudomonadota bacterium]